MQLMMKMMKMMEQSNKEEKEEKKALPYCNLQPSFKGVCNVKRGENTNPSQPLHVPVVVKLIYMHMNFDWTEKFSILFRHLFFWSINPLKFNYEAHFKNVNKVANSALNDEKQPPPPQI